MDYWQAHESDIIIHKAAKNAFDNLALKKLPTVKSLQAEPENISSQDLTGISHETTVGDMQRISSCFCQIGNQLDVADRQSKLELVFKPCFLQHVCHMEFDR